MKKKKPKSTKVLLRGLAARERKCRELSSLPSGPDRKRTVGRLLSHRDCKCLLVCDNGYRQAVSWLAHALWWNSGVLRLGTESEEIWLTEARGKPSPEAAVWLQELSARWQNFEGKRHSWESPAGCVRIRQRQFNSGKLGETEFAMSDSSLEQLWLGSRDSGSYGCCILNSWKKKKDPVYNLGMKIKNKL